jgi:hypothetical protein
MAFISVNGEKEKKNVLVKVNCIGLMAHCTKDGGIMTYHTVKVVISTPHSLYTKGAGKMAYTKDQVNSREKMRHMLASIKMVNTMGKVFKNSLMAGNTQANSRTTNDKGLENLSGLMETVTKVVLKTIKFQARELTLGKMVGVLL